MEWFRGKRIYELRLKGKPVDDGARPFATEEAILEVVRRNGPGRYAVYFKPQEEDFPPGGYNAEEEDRHPGPVRLGYLVFSKESDRIEFEDDEDADDF